MKTPVLQVSLYLFVYVCVCVCVGGGAHWESPLKYEMVKAMHTWWKYGDTPCPPSPLNVGGTLALLNIKM